MPSSTIWSIQSNLYLQNILTTNFINSPNFCHFRLCQAKRMRCPRFTSPSSWELSEVSPVWKLFFGSRKELHRVSHSSSWGRRYRWKFTGSIICSDAEFVWIFKIKSLASILFSVENWVGKGEYALNPSFFNLSEHSKSFKSANKGMKSNARSFFYWIYILFSSNYLAYIQFAQYSLNISITAMSKSYGTRRII